jgi:hypothetical protein
MFICAEMAVFLGLIVFVLSATVLLVTEHRTSTRQWSANADRGVDGRQRLGTDQPRAP